MDHRVEIVIPPLARTLTYSLPEELQNEIEVGYCVSVPLGRRKASGFVVSRSTVGTSLDTETLAYKIKALEASNLNQRCFDAEQLKFFRWVADYYSEPLSSVIDVAVPRAAQRRFEKTLRLLKDDKAVRRSKTQDRIIDLLHAHGGSCDWSTLTGQIRNPREALSKLEAANMVKVDSAEVLGQRLFKESAPAWAPAHINLNSAQTRALQALQAAIAARKFKPFLLHGVTGSGKTEVYIEAILEAQRAGCGVLLIVPEIALTPQLVDRFRARLGDAFVVLHSALSTRLRWDGWRALVEGRCRIAVGTRSAIFAPVHSLGLIIVDEEHDSSFKQSDGLRYNARDLAVVRARLMKCPVVLGSATPSLETFQNAQSERFTCLTLPARSNDAAPLDIELVDLNRIKPWDMVTRSISPRLHQALAEAMEQQGQAFILYNRRGFASYLQCERCEAVIECPNCSVTLTFHQSHNALMCHYCGLNTAAPEFCSACRDADTKKGRKAGETPKPAKLLQRGAGTEKIFDELRELFPDVQIDRLDRDTVTHHEHYRAILDDVRSGKTRILVGTQMIAKGHDLPGVTLVGIADCDVGLHMPDFRASERVFQLLTQAAGRAGRGQNPGRVILQTRVPHHFSLLRTLSQDYEGFAQIELRSRKVLGYPPFCRLLRIVTSSQKKEEPLEILIGLKKAAHLFISAHKLQIEILGPAPAPIDKIKAHWRAHLLFKAKSPAQLNQVVQYLKAQKIKSRQVRVAYDLDPQEMM